MLKILSDKGKYMPLVNLVEALSESIKKRYAVGGFVALDHSFCEAIIQAAEEKRVPVILMVPDGGFKLLDEKKFFPYLLGRIERSSAPIVLHLDHGESFEMVVKAIHYGFSSVMIDGSSLPLEANILLTKKVVEVSQATGVNVEAELGHVGGGEGNLDGGSSVDQDAFTKPEDAALFVEKTGIDALAVSFGTVHGLFKEAPKLDLERLNQIRESVDIPLVMHGGSGLSSKDYVNAIRTGINKINYFTDLSQIAVKEIQKVIKDKGGKVHYPELIVAAKQRVLELVKQQIEVFGTQPLTVP